MAMRNNQWHRKEAKYIMAMPVSFKRNEQVWSNTMIGISISAGVCLRSFRLRATGVRERLRTFTGTRNTRVVFSQSGSDAPTQSAHGDGCVGLEGNFSTSGTGDSVDSTASANFTGADLHNCEGGASRNDFIALIIRPITKPLGLRTTFGALGDITCHWIPGGHLTSLSATSWLICNGK